MNTLDQTISVTTEDGMFARENILQLVAIQIKYNTNVLVHKIILKAMFQLKYFLVAQFLLKMSHMTTSYILISKGKKNIKIPG